MRRTSAKSLPAPTGEQSVTVRKIDNGFIVQKCGPGRGGKWQSSEVYHPTNPLSAPEKPAARKGK